MKTKEKQNLVVGSIGTVAVWLFFSSEATPTEKEEKNLIRVCFNKIDYWRLVSRLVEMICLLKWSEISVAIKLAIQS